VSYSELNGLSKFPVDANNTLVIFYEMDGNIGHWVCVIYYPESDTISWFDSYGFKVGGALKGIPKMKLLKMRESQNTAMNIMNNYTNAVYSPYKLQSLKDAQTCGKHVCTRILMKHLDVKSYANWIVALSKSTGLSPDELVCVVYENPVILENNNISV
jgi:hypothetical protein